MEATKISRRSCEHDSETNTFPVDGFSDLGEFSKKTLLSTVEATKRCKELPRCSSDDVVLYREVIMAQSQKILKMMSDIMKHQAIKSNLKSLDLEEKFDLLADANDLILEKIGLNLDEASGKKKKLPTLSLTSVNSAQLIKTSWNRKIYTQNSSPSFSLLTANNVPRPQLRFKEKIDNSAQPFQPIIKEKPNSIRPLAIILEPTENGLMYSHPYECELEHFKPPPNQLNVTTPEIPKALEKTSLVYIDKVDQLPSLFEELNKKTEIAIDLEHHDYRSFLGITCLLQISTNEKDYIIDTLELRSDLQLLNEVFTDPKIVKVLHGADKDVEWLQRDLGLYLVNMFDTGQACRILNYVSASLAYLLNRFCKVDADKKYQKADWRIRPIPNEMIRYAREDTHYLLYIYHQLKNELISKGNEQKNLLLNVYERSKAICGKRYEKPVFSEDSHMELYQKSKKMFNSRQMYALSEICKWRNSIARNLDESIRYVLPNHMLLQISEILPREQQGVLACCYPAIPPLVRQQLNEIHSIVRAARELPLQKIESREIQMNVAITERQHDLDNPLFSPHDISPSSYEGGGKNTHHPALDSSITVKIETLKQPAIDLFSDVQQQTLVNSTSKGFRKVKKTISSIMMPYQRYLLIKAKNESKLEEKKKEEEEVAGPSTANENVVRSTEKKTAEEEEIVKDHEKEVETDEDNEETVIVKVTKKNRKRNPQQNNHSASKKLREDFQPFDYSKVDYKDFSNEGKGKKNKKKVFEGVPTPNFKMTRKPKRMISGNKSITYTKKFKGKKKE